MTESKNSQALPNAAPVDAVPGEPVAMLTVCGPTTGCGAQYAGNLTHCPNCGKVNFGRPTGTTVSALAASVASRAGMEPVKPDGHLHDDGCFTWAPGHRPKERDAANHAGWHAPFYLAPIAPAAPAEAKDTVRAEPAPVEVSRLAEEAKRLADELSMADGARSIPTGELYRGITHSQYVAKRQELHIAINRLRDLASMASTPASEQLRRDQIIDLISSVSNNSADHDVDFAFRVLDAANAATDASEVPADPHAHWIPSSDGLSRRNPAPDASVAMVPTSRTVELKFTTAAPEVPAARDFPIERFPEMYGVAPSARKKSTYECDMEDTLEKISNAIGFEMTSSKTADDLIEAVRSLAPAARQESGNAMGETELRNYLCDCLTRMDRARGLLTDGKPRPSCNWGMLDTATIRDALAAAQAAPVEAEAPKTVKWGYAKTVGNAIAQLQTMDAELPIYAAFHLEDGRCVARGVTFSRERVVGARWVDNRNKDVPYAIVVWSQPVESLFSPTASTSTAAPAGEVGKSE